MAVHDLDMARFLIGAEPVAILASGSCHVSPEIRRLEGPEAYDTANVIVRFENGKEVIIDVCRQAPYGYDQRAEVLGTKGMIATDNMYPNTARISLSDFTGNADMPFDFFMSRYKEAYLRETMAFVDCLVKDKPSPCSGIDGLVALVMSTAAGISAAEDRWVKFDEVARNIFCDANGCKVIDDQDLPEGANQSWTKLLGVAEGAGRKKKGNLTGIFS